ncbi:unnamed protein product [Paramecium sonneborni]|uniref:Uncharacterized protein n=1 Tax=Paramecium sonneborni TaxID=65129 RepID=A0A8S1KBZ0_9CILI|nr:unnamed protein product [Paramecium sonneborni]
MKVFFEDSQRKPLVCRGCAGRTLGYERACCQENEFLNVLKQNYIDGTCVSYFREILGMSQGCENFCEDHGCLYEFILTPQNIYEEHTNHKKQFSLKYQTLACKKCLEALQKNQQLNQFHIDLLNDEYFSLNKFGNDKKIIENEVKEVFEKMEKALKEIPLEQKQNEVEIRRKIIEVDQNQKQNQQNIQVQEQDKQTKRKQIEQLEQMKRAQEVRIQAIASQDGFHDYLHDDYLEGESVRLMIIGEENQPEKGYSITNCYKMFDDIQFL